MPEITLELSVGDVVVIGNRTLTVIDIDGSEVHFRVDDDLSASPLELNNNRQHSNPADSQAFRPKAK